jgi:DNA-binding response OmpR family regulator
VGCGFAPLTVAPTGDRALELISQASPDLVLMDVQLPDWYPGDLCVEIRLAKPAIRIVLVAAADFDPAPTLLQAGISGCVSRDLPLAAWPGLLTYVMSGGTAFNRSVVESLLVATYSAQARQPHLSLGPLQIDLARRLVSYCGRSVRLTPREFALLICLARNTDHAVTFDQLLNEAWGYDANRGSPAQVRLYVARLRNKLISQARAPDFIHTEWGIGYRLQSEVLRRENLQTGQLPPANSNSAGLVGVVIGLVPAIHSLQSGLETGVEWAMLLARSSPIA